MKRTEWVDPDDAPEWTDEMFAAADLHIGGKLIRAGTYPGAPAPGLRGRPVSDSPKIAVNIRLSPEVVTAFKSGGKGWQTRVDQALKDWLARAK